MKTIKLIVDGVEVEICTHDYNATSLGEFISTHYSHNFIKVGGKLINPKKVSLIDDIDFKSRHMV